MVGVNAESETKKNNNVRNKGFEVPPSTYLDPSTHFSILGIIRTPGLAGKLGKLLVNKLPFGAQTEHSSQSIIMRRVLLCHKKKT